MLYITGLRASNLGLITVRHVHELRRARKTTVRLIKNGADRHTIQISEGNYKLFTAIQDKLKVLCKDQHLSEPLFKGYGFGSKENAPIHGNTLLKNINKILIQASQKLGKQIRSHSFRVTRISDILEVTNIEVVAKIIGHTNVNSTQAYDRVRVDFDQINPLIDDYRKVDTSVLEKIVPSSLQNF